MTGIDVVAGSEVLDPDHPIDSEVPEGRGLEVAARGSGAAAIVQQEGVSGPGQISCEMAVGREVTGRSAGGDQTD
jgi:hypothetical protein